MVVKLQEEIEQKTFNIMISTTKLSARTVLRAVKAAFRLYQSKASQGKQSVRTLLRQNRGVSSVEIINSGNSKIVSGPTWQIKKVTRNSEKWHF